MSLNPYDDLLQVVRIETTRNDGKHRYGTGFPHFFSSKIVNSKQLGIPGLVTNRHVIDDAVWGSFFVNRKRPDKECSFGDTVEIKFERKDWIDHHDSSIDLSVLPLVPKVEEMSVTIKDLFINYYNELIPDKDTWEMFGPVENIVTFGFPNGFWDEQTNTPMARRGVTASHPELSYKGEEAFWVDVTIYPGMSGSPVFILDYGIQFFKSRTMTYEGQKIYFLGILSKMAIYSKDKAGVELGFIPTERLDSEILNVISSLGYVIKVTKLKDFDSILERIGFSCDFL